MIGGITGNGHFISIHDGSQGITWWMGFPPARTASSSTRIHILRSERFADRDEHGLLGGRRDMSDVGVQLAGAVVE
jgi:hypothetical protein